MRIDAAHPPVEDARRQGRLRARKRRLLQKAEEANPQLLQTDELQTFDGPREMTKADICNVEFISARDLDDVFDGIIEAASFQHALEDCECRWNVADVNHDLMDLSDPAPFKSKMACQQMQRDVAWQLTQRDVVPFRSKRK